MVVKKIAVLNAVFFLAFFAMSFPFFADEGSGVKKGTTLDCTVTTNLEAKVKLSEEITVPFLVGSSMLTSNNNVQFNIAAELSPVSVNGTFETVWTPIAFFQLVGGTTVGSGWNIPMADGLRLNERSGLHDSELTGNGFSGLVWSVKGGSVLQFDFAAIKPGDWNHIVFRTYHSLLYRALSSVGNDTSWLYEDDAGENRNGWNYYGNYILGYRMPTRFQMVGLVVEDDLYLYKTRNRDRWGDDVARWTFSVMGNYRFTDQISCILLAQARTVRNFTGGTGEYGFYQDRVIDDDNQYKIEFYRLVATVSVKLK